MNKTRELAIFEYVLIVQVNPSTGQPFIAYRYPPSTDQGAKDSISGPIMRFCFPELELSDQSKKKDKKKKLLGGMGVQQSETFSFVLTDSDGSRKFGYCRRMRVPNPDKPSDTIIECHCMLSLCTSFTLFRRILDIVEERRKASTKPKPTAVFSFLQSVLANKFPDPGETITVYLVDLDKGTFIISPGFPSVLPAHELRTLEMSLESIVASGKKGRAFDLDVAAAFLDFFQSILSGYAQFMRNNKLNVQAFRDAQPPAIKSFLDQFEASQMWFSFIMERETMSEKGTLRNCVLLKAQTHTPVAHNQMEQQPAVFEVCCKCGCDVEGDTQDKDGRPICMACLEAKDRKGLGMGGWFKNLRAESGYFGAGEAADESKALKSKVGNVSKRFGKSKEKPSSSSSESQQPSPATTPSNGASAPPSLTRGSP
ncbi:uDENN domain containing protein, partial [Acanthamoeba castellanii str. Neff]